MEAQNQPVERMAGWCCLQVGGLWAAATAHFR